MQTEKPFKQGNLRAAAKRGAVKTAPPATVPIEVAEPPPKPPKPAKPKPAKGAAPKVVAAVEQVPHRCGHVAALDILQGDSEEKRENRRENVRRSCCSACAAGKRAETLKGRSIPGRLPHGSNLAVSYDADSQTWSGSLEALGRTYYGRESGLFRLCVSLDRQYRAGLTGDGK